MPTGRWEPCSKPRRASRRWEAYSVSPVLAWHTLHGPAPPRKYNINNAADASSDGNYILLGDGFKAALYGRDGTPLETVFLNETENFIWGVLVKDDGSMFLLRDSNGMVFVFRRQPGPLAGDVVPPAILSVSHSPEEPEYDDKVTARVNATDPGSGLDSVLLSYWNGSSWVNRTMTLREGVYEAVIPALPYGTAVKYRVYAVDKAGNVNVTRTYVYAVSDRTAPEIGSPTMSPAEPTAGQEVTVTVAVKEPVYGSGVRNVTLWYRVDKDGWQPKPMALKDTVWTAVIPGQRGGATVEFYVEAFDNAGNRAVTATRSYRVSGSAEGGLSVETLAVAVTLVLLVAIAYFVYRGRRNV